ncbi:MAG: hypothetical protein NTW19_11190 [Planctomycetota bacterium]|nr:hypothetical protein [Planctomycetota bacterium]
MSADTIRALAQISANLNWLAFMLEDHKNVGKAPPHLITATGRNTQTRRRHAAGHAVDNVRSVLRVITESRQLADQIPDKGVALAVKETLAMTWNTIGQADVPADFHLQRGEDAEAIGCAREGLRRAWELCGTDVARLSARVSVLAEDLAGQPAPKGWRDALEGTSLAAAEMVVQKPGIQWKQLAKALGVADAGQLRRDHAPKLRDHGFKLPGKGGRGGIHPPNQENTRTF